MESYEPPQELSKHFRELNKPSDLISPLRGISKNSQAYLAYAIKFKGSIIGVLICENSDSDYIWSLDCISLIIEHAAEMKDPLIRLLTLINISSKELRHQFILNNMRDVVLIYDEVGRIKFVSKNIEKYCEYKAEDLMGIVGSSIIHPDQFDQLYYYLDRLSQGLVDEPHDYFMRQISGEYQWWRFSCQPIMKDGKLVEVISVISNVDKEKKDQQKLEEREKNFRMLAENASDIIFTMDINLKFTYISPSVERIRGYTVEEAMSQTPEEALTPASLDVAMEAFAEEIEIEKREIKNLLRTRTLELEETCKDGSTVWSESSFSALRDEENKFAGFLGITRDITERKLAEMKLRESEERYRFILDNVDDIIMAYDRTGTITFITPNVSEVLDYSAQEMIGLNVIELIHPDHQEAVIANLNELNAGEMHKPHEYQIKNKYGNYVWVRLKCHPVMNDGELVEAVSVVSNIDEEVNRRNALIQNEEKYRQIAENMHDMVITFNKGSLKPTYISPSCLRMLQRSYDEVVNIFSNCMVDNCSKILTSKSIDKIRNFIQRNITDKKLHSLDLNSQTLLELELISKDGSLISTDTIVSYMVIDTIPYVLTVSRDVSHRESTGAKHKNRFNNYQATIDGLAKSQFPGSLTINKLKA